MIKLGGLGAKTSFDIAQAAAISELSEQQAKELIPTREAGLSSEFSPLLGQLHQLKHLTV
jgi:hypothetical protein